MFIYAGHMGSLYATDYKQDFDDLYCETCGDYDTFVGEAHTKKEVLDLFDGEIDDGKGSGGWGREYFMEFLDELNLPDE